jgi:hypothetical protein
MISAKKPCSPFALVDPNIDETSGGDIIYGVRRPRELRAGSGQLLVIVTKLADHFLRANAFLIVTLLA